jgi:phenylacetic acid degradation operon negative regulatory protein
MKSKSGLLMYQMLWTAEKLLQPTFRNLDRSFEGWAYQNGLLQQLRRLEASGLVESSESSFDGDRFHRLTEAGRIAALGGRDPEEAWNTTWDRKWRLILFDVPESKRSLRRRLTRSLAAIGCGCLQGSVWITATRPTVIESAFPEEGEDCSHLMVLEAESRGRQVDRKMVETAWDFGRINECYEDHLAVMERFPELQSDAGINELKDWAAEENTAWLAAVQSDPLLPASLLPKGYLGRRAWKRRKTVLAAAGALAERLVSSGEVDEPAEKSYQ